jgi:dTDP-4-amino-4,6-dideoxygalactose transaminase
MQPGLDIKTGSWAETSAKERGQYAPPIAQAPRDGLTHWVDSESESWTAARGSQKKTNVTKSVLPPLEEYIRYVERIWQSNQLTNNGPLVRELEASLRHFLGVRHVILVSNGTIALQLAIKALGLHGEIITTPFSYVATTTSIIWEGCQPVFVDIDAQTLCLDPLLIEKAISPKTAGILATHVYGYPCALDNIGKIAHAHGLKVIYDGAHAFGSGIDGTSLLAHGDISVCSFHATKLFHTVEGGCLIAQEAQIAKKVSLMRSFGHIGEEDYYCVGINAKNSEFHAAMGLALLPNVESLIERRKQLSEIYDRDLASSELRFPRKPKGLKYNYAYYPIIFRSEDQMLRVRKALKENGIYPRRYFFPSLNQLPYCWGDVCPVSESVARRVLCLPLYPQMEDTLVRRISEIVVDNLRQPSF